MKFSIKYFFSKCDQIRRNPHLLKKSLMENFIFCAVIESTVNANIVDSRITHHIIFAKLEILVKNKAKQKKQKKQQNKTKDKTKFSPFQANILFLHHLKKSDKPQGFCCFQGDIKIEE